MDKDTLMKMDPNMAVSIVNLKLRDFYCSLSDFCEDIGVDEKALQERFSAYGYDYKSDINQFR